MGKFIDRVEELKFLNKEYEKNESSLVVLYGRRRIGKTSIIKEFGKDKDMIYFLATEESEIQNMMNFCTKISEYLKYGKVLINMNNWIEVFKFLVMQKTDRKKVIVIDEFQYLGKTNPSFPSVFQKIWDEILKDENVMVILCGSLINMMQNQVLNYSSPLYGRRTGQIRLKQIPFKYYSNFFEKELNRREQIERYSVTGGVPKYIESFRNSQNIFEQIKENILNNQSYLYEEPYFLLQNEVSEIGSYFSIIKSIAAGNRKLGKIAASLCVNQTSLSKYLQTLINLDIIEREVPITEQNPDKSKKGQYRIKDNFICFWFKFIYPSRDLLELGEERMCLDKIRNNFVDNHVAFIYEDICRQEMWDLNISQRLGMNFDKLGKWWDNNEEIDIVGIDTSENNIIFGECKYTNKKMDVDVYYKLKEKAKLVDWNRENRNEKYILFSISGYTDKLRELSLSDNDIILGEEIL